MKQLLLTLVFSLLIGCDNAVDGPPVSVPYKGQPDIQPECANPAPLTGQRGKTLEGWPTDYAVELAQLPDGSVDPAVLEEIKRKYGSDLIPHAGHPHVTHWTATLSREAVASLRCEPTVVEISHPPLLEVVL
jgi:hypothetical protein